MSRKEIESKYNVRDGIIRSLGKFEGEPVYAVALYDFVMEGLFGNAYPDCDCSETCECPPEYAIVSIDDEFRAEYPEVGSAKSARVYESDSGFVSVELID